MSELLKKLQGGDMRSIGRVDEVVAEVNDSPELFRELIEGLFHQDEIVRMRVADAIEKVSKKYPYLLAPHQNTIVQHFAVSPLRNELKMSLPLILGYLNVENEELSLITEVLHQWLDKAKNKFVKVMCMQGLADQALKHEWLKDEVISTIYAQMAEGSASIKARGRILLKKLEN